MAGVLDVFKGNAFNVVSLTNAINIAPHDPARIGQMGLFREQGVTTWSVLLEYRKGVLQLIQTAPRGSPAKLSKRRPRDARNFMVPHLPLNDAVLASEVAGIRAFASQSEMETVLSVVNEKLAVMRQAHEVTKEWHRMGALKGVVYDADNSTVIYNFYDEYKIDQQDDFDFDLGTDATSQKSNCLKLVRKIEDALGAAVNWHTHAFCGKDWFDAFVEHPTVKTAYEHWGGLANMGGFLRETQRKGFPFADIVFEEYRGKLTTDEGVTTKFIADDEARFFPVGVQDLFMTYNGPADFIETINTVGLPFYAKQQIMDFDRGVNLHTQSNPLCLCTRPRVLIRGFTSS